jgi:hypothetical protein
LEQIRPIDIVEIRGAYALQRSGTEISADPRRSEDLAGECSAAKPVPKKRL